MSVNLSDILYHRAPMLLVDRLIERTENGVRVGTTFRDKPYGFEGEYVIEPLLVEIVAQATAVLVGLEGPPRPGMLVAVDGFEFLRPVHRDWDLEVRAEITQRLGRFCLAAGSVHHDGETVARGSLKFYIEEGEVADEKG